MNLFHLIKLVKYNNLSLLIYFQRRGWELNLEKFQLMEMGEQYRFVGVNWDVIVGDDFPAYEEFVIS